MRVIIHELPYKSRSDWFEIIPIGDIHLGNALCDETALRRTVKHIKETDRCYWGGMGDMIDGINRADRRFQESQIAEWLWGYDDVVGPQIEVLTQILNPIKDKCLWMLRGNHEDFVLQRFQRDVYYEICRNMGLSEKNPIMLGYRGFIVLKMRRRTSGKGNYSTYTYTIFAHHGYGGGRLEGPQAGKIAKALPSRPAPLRTRARQDDRSADTATAGHGQRRHRGRDDLHLHDRSLSARLRHRGRQRGLQRSKEPAANRHRTDNRQGQT